MDQTVTKASGVADTSAGTGPAPDGNAVALRYGFIGLGNLGAKLARSLLNAGFNLTVHDASKDAARPLVEAGAGMVASPADLAAGADAVITCLPSPAISQRVLSGPDGLLSAMRPGSTWIEMSTVGVDQIKAMAAEALAGGIETLEAPVTGGVHRAAAGEITVLVGGKAEVLARHRAAFDTMCGPLFHLGEIGSASTIKVITNMLAFDHLIAAGEAMLLASKAGLDMRQCYEVIKASSGTSIEFNSVMPVILSGTYDTSFTMELACKDLQFAMDLGEKHGVSLALSRLVADMFQQGREHYGPQAWTANVVRSMETASGVSLRADGFAKVMTEGGSIDEQDY